MRLFYLVEQQHSVGRLADSIGQQTAVLVTHIARRRTNQFGDGVLLGVFAHVEANQFDTQFLSQHLGYLRLSHTRRTDEEQRCQRFVVIQQTSTRHLHRFNHLTDGFVLSVDL